MFPAVSLIMLYKDREAQVIKTLESIVDQRYEPLEIIVVEDGDDGGTISAIAKFYGARHLQVPRGATVESGRLQYYTKNPPFGNLPVLRNRGIAATAHDILIFQDAEVKHDTQVVAELAAQVVDNPKVLVNCSMKMEDDEAGTTWHWRSHPTEPPTPCWAHIGTPNCIQKATLLAMGGFEETMAGYGYDDDYFFYQIRRNGIEVRMTADSVATHQWHTNGSYDYPSGRANRALCARLNHETNKGLRPPIANYRSREVLDSIFPVVDRAVLEPLVRGQLYTAPVEFKKWAARWLAGEVDWHGDDSREAAEQMHLAKIGALAMITEAAWALRCWENAMQAGATDSVEHLMAWARTAATLASRNEGAK